MYNQGNWAYDALLTRFCALHIGNHRSKSSHSVFYHWKGPAGTKNNIGRSHIIFYKSAHFKRITSQNMSHVIYIIIKIIRGQIKKKWRDSQQTEDDQHIPKKSRNSLQHYTETKNTTLALAIAGIAISKLVFLLNEVTNNICYKTPARSMYSLKGQPVADILCNACQGIAILLLSYLQFP